MAWRGIDRVDLDLVAAREELPDSGSATSPTYARVEYDTVLAIGSDERPDDYLTDQEDAFADALLFWLVPTDGGDPVLVSLPRDLLVVDPCTGEETKLDRTLAGCGSDVSGPELVAIAVEDYTGIAVDHFAMFGFDAFVEVIDAIGGIEICVDYPLREGTVDLLPAGCTVVDGATALRWTRSRTTQEFVGGEWRFVEGTSDLDRTSRHQVLMFAMLTKLKAMRSPATLAGIADSLGGAIILDESLSMSDSVAMAWGLRSVPSSQIRRIVVPTEPAVTADGSFALRATASFLDLLEG